MDFSSVCDVILKKYYRLYPRCHQHIKGLAILSGRKRMDGAVDKKSISVCEPNEMRAR